MKTDTPKQKPGLLRKCFRVIAIVLVCAAGAVITLITELLIGDIQHEARFTKPAWASARAN